MIAQLNINSLPHEFEQLVSIINGHVDILVVIETKLDETLINSSPYMVRRKQGGGGVIVFIKDIPILNKHTLPEDIEA